MEMNKKYKFGNIVFSLKSSVKMQVDERFEAFLVDESETEDYIYEAVPIKHEKGQKTTRIERTGNHIRIEVGEKFLPRITIANLFSVAETGKHLLEKNAFILHASYIIYKGQAILFSAPSETGKSTQARFWEEKLKSITVNEDRVIITNNKGIYYANGCWAMGHANTCHNISAPIKAIVLLEQGKENKILKEHHAILLKKMIGQCTFDEKNAEQSNQMITMLIDLLKNTHVISYSCINHISSVDILENYLWT